ncbi:MAG: hypothetical protein IKM32_04265 [Clostridia bacterium]|nr:hypothetical protein [Clostridia bacterium]
MTKYLVGIDGGGSKTDFLLCDLEFNQIARRISTRSNPNDIGIDALITLVRENLSALILESKIDQSQIVAAFAGIAGLTCADYAERITKVLCSALPNAKCAALHDGINVLYVVFADTDGVSIICGTGSSCFVKRGNDIIRIGGYGKYDLTGNGYEIGKAAIAHALKAVDGREKSGALASLIKEKFGNDLVGRLDSLIALTKNEIAALAPLVLKACEQGDEHAQSIIDENMRYIAKLIERAGDYFEGEYFVALAGGILKSTVSQAALYKLIPSRVRLITSEHDPAFGAAAKAKSLL